MKKYVSMFLVFTLVLSLFAGCGSAPAAEPQAETHIFTDDCGREVEVPAGISRIVPTGPLSQMILFSLAPDMLVGLASKMGSATEGIIPEKYRSLPYFGQLYGSSDLNVESLALAAPQVIIDIGEMKGSTAEDVEALQAQLGIPCVFIESTLATLPETYEKLGRLLGLEAEAAELAAFCGKVYDRSIALVDGLGDDKVQAIYIPAYEGLSVLARGSYHAELIDLLCENVAVCEEIVSKGTGNPVDMEQIALWDPECIIFGTPESYATLETDPAWQELQAVKSGRVLLVPDAPLNWMGSPPGAQRILGLIWLSAVLYPENCDYDVKAEVTEFYEIFFHCSLTDDMYASITENAFFE